LEIGHSHRRAVLIMWICAALVAFGLVVVGMVGGWTTVAGVALVLAVMVMVTTGRPRALLGHKL
jgi:UDP-GlcNAc:undecaprenyl-phosphate/decaprenyl-phosphate GlcNAc-1-phosphate transferase